MEKGNREGMDRDKNFYKGKLNWIKHRKIKIWEYDNYNNTKTTSIIIDNKDYFIFLEREDSYKYV